MNNFYNEEAPTRNLEKLGTVIPAPAVGPCMTALLCVRLGNEYGTSWSAWPIADRLLKKQGAERWKYYLEKILPGEIRIIEKLLQLKPRAEWMKIAGEMLTESVDLKDKTVRDLVEASVASDDKRVTASAQKLILAYYGKGKQQGF